MAAGGAAVPLGEHASASRCYDIFPLSPLPKSTSPCTSKSSRVRGRVRRQQRAQDLAASAIDALNSLYAAQLKAHRAQAASVGVGSPHVAEVQKYIFDCCYEFAATSESSDECASHFTHEGEDEAYDDADLGGPTPLIADKVSLPTDAGTFPVVDYIGPELAAYAYAEPSACLEHDLIPQLSAKLARSCHRVPAEEYAKLVARMCN